MISTKGQENTYTIANILSQNCSGVSPYHYAELWLSIIVAKTFSANYLLSLIFVVYPILIWGWIIGILSLWELFEKIPLKFVVFGVVLLFVSGLHFNFYYKIDFMSLTGVYSRNFLTELGDKYGYVYLLLTLSILLMNYIGLEIALFALLMIPFVFAAALPGVFGAFPIILYIFRNRFEKPIRPFSIWAFCLIGYFLFYYFLGGKVGQSNDLNIDFFQSLTKFQSFKYIRTSFNIVAGTTIQILILYLLWVIYFVIVGGKSILYELKQPIPVFIFGCFVCGLFTWAGLFEIMDMVQLVNGCGILLLNAYIVYLIIKTTISPWAYLSISKKYFAISFALAIVSIQFSSKNFTSHYFLASKYDKTYEQIVNSKIQSPKNCEYVFIANQESNFENIFSLLSYHKLSTHFVYLSKNQILPICLDDFDVDIKGLPLFEKSVAEKTKKSGFFYQFVQNQKKSGTFISIDESRSILLDSLKINYLALGINTPISPQLANKFQLVATDPSSGESFYVRKILLK